MGRGLLPAPTAHGNWAESMPYKKPFVMIVGFACERLPYLLIGLLVLAFALSSPAVALIAVLIGVGVASSGAGVATPAWMDMIAKVIPVRRRGIWFGLGHGLGPTDGCRRRLFRGGEYWSTMPSPTTTHFSSFWASDSRSFPGRDWHSPVSQPARLSKRSLPSSSTWGGFQPF